MAGLLAAVPAAAQIKVKTKVKPGSATTAAASASPASAPGGSLRYTLAMPAPQTLYFEVHMDMQGFG